ncbi:flagellar hook-length control protein FliK [Jeotgalibacillus terrae]|uniref:Flagellar hook-length control protein FliK n=1 Tax=Jeotgalibacillus terrae TaxID=587735 RepID=A0ABW5ZMB8_9BACL|nr:flagellar hook-length control protein FliK [Jeotgalibacillus terrae]MBM7579860.1 flagellar hook-length control protein FliK [Jeotgalibacillus terrae]
MIGNLTLQGVQAPQQLGSVKESSLMSGSTDFSQILAGLGEKIPELIENSEVSGLETILSQLNGIAQSEDLAEFMTEVKELFPEIKQLFTLFSEEELLEMTPQELMSAAGISPEVTEELSDVSAGEMVQAVINLFVKPMSEKAENVEPQLKESNIPDPEQFVRQIIEQLQIVKPSGEQPAKETNSQVAQPIEALKLLALVKGLTLLQEKQPMRNQEVLKQQNSQLQQIFGSIQKVFEAVVKDMKNITPAEQKAEQKSPELLLLKNRTGIQFTQLIGEKNQNADVSVKPETVKNDQQMINLQSLQLQSAPVKWSLQPVKQPDSAQQLMEQFQNIMQKAKFGKVNGTEKLMIRLQPEHLGTLKIELLQKDGMMTARIIASTAVAKDMIDSQLHQLRQSFTSQQLQVEKIEIMQTQTETRLDKDGKNDQQTDHRDREHDQQSGQNQSEDEQTSFHDIFLNIEV